MYLAIMLVIVVLLVFYNEVNSKMNLSEYVLLAISLIAIIRASFNYIKLDNINEGFSNGTGNNNMKKKHRNNSTNNKDILVLQSEDSEEYFDSDEVTPDITNNQYDNFNSINNLQNENQQDDKAINKIDDLLYGNNLNLDNKSSFVNTPTTTKNSPTTTQSNSNDIDSKFEPKIIIGKCNKQKGFGSMGVSESWNSAFINDGFNFTNTMKPNKNLWRDTNGYYDEKNEDNQWSKSMDSYNKGKWNTNTYKRPSDYTDYYNPSSPSSTTSPSTPTNSSGQPIKLCGQYNDLNEDPAGNIIVSEYKEAKKWYPGYTYVPPVHWDVPQRHPDICRPPGPNVHKLTGLVDRGLPINALEINQNGRMADTEDTVSLTNVGSMMPSFYFQEQPFSKPYV